jgi:hypothetical protein
MKAMKKFIRKKRHKMYVNMYINELRWESLNIMISASATEWTDATTRVLINNSMLIRKYERRKRWLKF